MEILNVYTEVDPGFKITTTTRRATWTDLDRDETAYVYCDKGVGRFSGNFVHYLTVSATACDDGAYIAFWALTNDLNDLRTIDNAGGSWLAVSMLYASESTFTLNLSECYSGSVDGDTYVAQLDTPYYLKIARDESVEDYGTLYCYIYSDAGRNTLLHTLSVTLHTPKKDFRYIHAVNTFNADTTPYLGSGYTENLEVYIIALSVRTLPVTDITDTKATGNGIIVDMGLSAVTQHGHCWDETIFPTTTNSSSGLWGKTSLGDGSLGSFTSSLENLLAGQKYWVRAYATNTEGTVYGASASFTAGYTSTALIGGNLAIVQGRIQYIDAYGVERYVTGAKA